MDLQNDDVRADLSARGYSRRAIGRVFSLLAAGAAVGPLVAPAAYAQTSAAGAGPRPQPKALIGANECWEGPLEPGARAAAAAISGGNRYTGSERADFVNALASIENVPPAYVMAWPGSSDPLSRIIVTYCSPTRGLVTADPTFELAESVAKYIGAPVKRVPLTADHAHDVKAMLAADPNAGIYYVCTPNNPSATLTGLKDVEWLLANKPAGSIVLLDEAYIHFSDAPAGAYLAAQDKEIIVLRTFSKLFGMAGMRLGATIAKPALMMKTMRYDGGMVSYALPTPSVVCGTASLLAGDLIRQRRAEMLKVRADTLAFLDKRGLAYVPPQANFFMVDWKKPAAEVRKAMAAEGVDIGRSWPIWPTRSRITIGSAAEMDAFKRAVVTLNL
ncbi:aminotransferase [Phenylobacterium kunshanense]|uniref:Aminotransferase n=2 Tax=Phenylobacterium kunshanense TaxID=1445034 RepID=A0A328BLQ8_9CAUL|nr:aminotransferase [Phenylobacterium kunshanense]